MSGMTVKEAYRILQAECGIEYEDEVKLLRMYKKYEMGCDLCPEDQRSMRVGDNYFADPCGSGMKLRDKNKSCVGFAPFFCLELVEKAKPKPPPIMVGEHEVVFLDNGKIRVCQEVISKETLRLMLERLEGKN